jgi:hypothetical protein
MAARARSGAGTSGKAASFAGHYGQLILTNGIAPIPKALFLYQGALGLSPQQVWFISYVLSHKWDEELPHPRLQELARHATLGLRQIKKLKNSIMQAGLLEVTPRYGAVGEQDANSYDFGLLFDKLEKAIIADPGARGDGLVEDAAQGGQALGEARNRGSEEGAVDASTARATRDYSFAARYGRVVLRRGVAAVPRALFTYQAELGLAPQQLWFIGYILSFQWSTELPYPSLRKMAQNTGYSERQIHRIKDDLVRAGHLRVIERRGADGSDTTSAYDFSELLKTLNTLIRKDSLPACAKSTMAGEPGQAPESMSSVEGREAGNVQQVSHQPLPMLSTPPEALEALEPLLRGGEPCVSGGVNGASEAREPDDSGGVNCASEGGVNPMSVGRVNCTSYEIESIKEEADKEEPHQQQPPAENDEACENAYYTLVDVGVIPSIALDLAHQLEPDQILGWVRYYLSVLSKQDNLDSPLGVLVSRLRSGDEPPYVPSPADLQGLRLQLSRFR